MQRPASTVDPDQDNAVAGWHKYCTMQESSLQHWAFRACLVGDSRAALPKHLQHLISVSHYISSPVVSCTFCKLPGLPIIHKLMQDHVRSRARQDM